VLIEISEGKMDISRHGNYDVTHCNACGLIIFNKSKEKPDLDMLDAKYQKHLKYHSGCKKYHDNLPSIEEIVGLLND
jgi:hypothetical protein